MNTFPRQPLRSAEGIRSVDGRHPQAHDSVSKQGVRVVETVSTPIRFEVTVDVEVTASAEGGFLASNEDLHIAALGATEADAVASFKEGVQALVQFCVERRLPLPAPIRG